jgi:hypothetical protein
MRSFTALLTAATLLVAAPAAHADPLVGIGEQSPAMFAAPAFQALGVPRARYVVSWDALHSKGQRGQTDAYLLAARASGTRVLLSFGRSSDHPRQLPSARRLAREFEGFRARYPWVTDYVTWNEANHCSQPTCRRPDRVADYYVALKRTCPSCRIVGADVLDDSRVASWVRRFAAVAGRNRRMIWGLHNYIDANRFRTRGTRALLGATKGEVWFTETGGLVQRKKHAQVPLPASPEHAAQAARWVFKLAALSPRVKRVYFYHWSPSVRPDATWDSALVDKAGRPRPAYRVLLHWLLLERAARKASG